MRVTRCPAAKSAGLRAPDVAGWDLKNDIGLSGFHTKHALVFSGSYDLPGDGAFLGGWRGNWSMFVYSGQAQTVNCQPATGEGTGCYALVVGDPYAGSHDVNQFYNPAAFANPSPVSTVGQTDFSPLGGKRTQVTGPPMRQLDLGLAKQFRVWGQRQFESPCRVFQRHEHAVVQPARLDGFQGCEELREHHGHAQQSAPVPAGRQALLVSPSNRTEGCRRRNFPPPAAL